MAQKIETKRYSTGGLEGTLDFAATSMLVIGLIASVVTLILFKLFGLVSAFSIVINTVLIWLLLRFAAESIRLQKSQAGIPYGGEITQPDTKIVYNCSACGAMLHSDTRCDACGAEIESS